jgi:hypothetical protein
MWPTVPTGTLYTYTREEPPMRSLWSWILCGLCIGLVVSTLVAYQVPISSQMAGGPTNSADSVQGPVGATLGDEQTNQASRICAVHVRFNSTLCCFDFSPIGKMAAHSKLRDCVWI